MQPVADWLPEPEPVVLPAPWGSLYLWIYGDTGPALLWCHGAGLCGRAFEPVFARMAPLPVRVAAIDLNGHGCSSPRPDLRKAPWEAFRQDVAEAARLLEQRFGLAGGVGHSGGGAVLAMEQIRRNRFPRLVLLDPILAPDCFFPAASSLADRARRRKLHFPDREGVRARLRTKSPFNRWENDLFEAYLKYGFRTAEDGGVTLCCPGEVEAAFYEGGSTGETLRRLAAMRCPTLIVTGADSYMAPYAREQWAHAPAGSRLEILPDCGHFIAQEKPDETARLIREWFGFS